FSARGDAMSAGSAFGGIVAILRRASGVRDDEPTPIRHVKLRARLGRSLRGDELRRAVEFFREILGAPVPETEASVELRAARRARMLMGDQSRRAWEAWIAAQTKRSPLLVALDALQWIDFASVQLVGAALRRAGEPPLLVIALGRPAVHERFPS